MAKVLRLVEWVKQQKPVRVFLHYVESRGPLLAGGLAFQAIFGVFAALWVGFSVAGLILQANPELFDAFISVISTSVPGLIDTGEGGILKPRQLLGISTLASTGAIALAGLLFTVLSWLDSFRKAVRIIFGLPAPLMNAVLLKLRDAGLGLGFGLAILVSSALLVFSTQLAGIALDFLGFNEDSIVSLAVGQGIGLVLMFALDTAILGTLYRLISGLAIPMRRLLYGSMIGAAALGVLKVLGSALLGGATRNPLLASFAVFIGLLIWFNLICQVVLISASWIAVGMADAELIADPAVEKARREEQQRQDELLAQERAQAEARSIAALPWWKRLFVRNKAVSHH